MPNTWKYLYIGLHGYKIKISGNVTLTKTTLRYIKTTPNAFVKNIIQACAKYAYHNPIKSQDIQNQLIWFNSHIQIDNKPAYFKYMYTSGIKYVHQLLDTQGNLLQYTDFKNKYNRYKLFTLLQHYKCNTGVLGSDVLG